jgi:hypothetical protein
VTLPRKDFWTANGNPLDWFYGAKLVYKLNREEALAVDTQKIGERLAITKERYRVIIEKLWRIIDYKWEYLERYQIQRAFVPSRPRRIFRLRSALAEQYRSAADPAH